MNINVMGEIMSQKKKDVNAAGIPALTPEIIAVAEHKRSTFDLPTNAVKVDPLR